MSKNRIPVGEGKVLLNLFYQDGFCTVMAIWDRVEIERLLEAEKCVTVVEIDGLQYYAKRSKNSSSITTVLTMEIVKRWHYGQYVKVFPRPGAGGNSADWIS